MVKKSIQKKNTIHRIRIVIFGLIIFLVGLYAYVYIFGVNAKAQEDARVIAKVSSMVQVPENEIPDVGTVTDPAQLSQQPFFKDAQAGDKVIVYKSIGKAILYRPSTKKIIEIAPLLTLQSQP